MNLRFDCFNWNKWSLRCQTSALVCLTASNTEKYSQNASRVDFDRCLTGTGGLSNRCPRDAPVCVSANIARRARGSALCGRERARRRRGVVA